MKRLILLIVTLFIGIALLYLSRFWFLNLWPRSGLFGLEALHPQGGLVGRWLRGTPFAPFELLIWVTGAFLVLTYLQKLIDFILPAADPEKESPNDH